MSPPHTKDETIRCTFCGRKGARRYSCPHDGCDGVSLCERCFTKRKHLLNAANHEPCRRVQHVEPLPPFEGEVGETLIVETIRRCGRCRIRAVSLFVWQNLRWIISSGQDDDLLIDALAYCQRKAIKVTKMVLADGEEIGLGSTGATVQRSASDRDPLQWDHQQGRGMSGAKA